MYTVAEQLADGSTNHKLVVSTKMVRMASDLWLGAKMIKTL